MEQFREVLIKYKYEPFFEIKEENNQYFLVGKGFEYSYKFNKDWGIKRIKNKIKSLLLVKEFNKIKDILNYFIKIKKERLRFIDKTIPKNNRDWIFNYNSIKLTFCN